MKTIKLNQVADTVQLASQVAAVLREGGLVCLPCHGRYRIVADLENADAVMQLMAAKSRMKAAPSLVFIEDVSQLDRVAGNVHPLARKLATKIWPGALTIRVQPSQDLPAKVLKQLGGKKSRVGVRQPDDPLFREVAKAAGTPLLVSSANREKKSGDSSPAQVAKNFGMRIVLFLDGGDLKPDAYSTVIDVVDDAVVVERPGSVDQATLDTAAS